MNDNGDIDRAAGAAARLVREAFRKVPRAAAELTNIERAREERDIGMRELLEGERYVDKKG